MPPRKPTKPTTESWDKIVSDKSVSNNQIKSKPNPVKQGPGLLSQIGSFLKSDKFRITSGIILGLFTLYLSAGMISYLMHGAADQSIMNLSWRELNEYRSQIHNVTSVSGAVLSHLLIQRSFGLAAFFILFFLSVLTLRIFNVKLTSLWKAFFHSAYGIIYFSVLLGFINLHFRPMTFFALGGEHGDFVSNQISSYVGNLGNLLILGGILLIYLIISFSRTIPILSKLFGRTRKEEISEEDAFEDLGPTVAVGTELVPEEWLNESHLDKETDLLEEEEDLFPDEEIIDLDDLDDAGNSTKDMEEDDMIPGAGDNGSSDEVGFEIENTIHQEDQPVDALEVNRTLDENDNPDYSLAKLGKYDPRLDLSKYKFPELNLLKIYGTDNDTQIDLKEQHANKDRITKTLQHYGIEIKNIKATVGPTITLYEIVPKDGVRISKIRNLESDIMLSLAATGIRIIAPIPGKGTIGIEVPNSDPQVVSMHSVIASRKFQESKMELPVAFGKTITNEVFMVDLTKMPHLLVAGATGQGKSVGLNAIITSLLYHKHPAELKFVLIDPKKVEFNIYEVIEKHFLAKLPDGEDAIITDTTKVVETLSSLCAEMDERYDLLKKAHARNIKEYNEKFVNRQLNPEKGHKFLPYIVVIVDEFGDLIMTAGKEVEMPIARIAQLARAIGIHMIIATQRPSVNIITGVIKANFPARVAFRVSSMIDSRTIIDSPGANQLVGRGDMLFTQGNELSRVQCAFVDTPEVENIVHFIGDQRGYPSAFYLPEYVGKEGDAIDAASVDLSKRDPLFDDAARLIVANQQGSTSLIQRKFSIGYNRAGRIVDQLEVAGIIGPFEGSKARQVLVVDDNHLEMILKQLN